MNKEEILKRLNDSKVDWEAAKKRLSNMRLAVLEQETVVIALDLERRSLQEQLRVEGVIHPEAEVSLREEEIERYRQRYPGICEEAKTRDIG